MKYLSIDIETTGLNPVLDQVLEFCAVADDFETPMGKLPSFTRLVKHERIKGNPFALQMNAEILKLISQSKVGCDHVSQTNSDGVCTEDQLLYQFAAWLKNFNDESGMYFDTMNIKVGGHNAAGFDVQFIKRLPGYGEVVNFHHRVLDVGSLYFEPTDHELPGTQKCLTRAGFGANSPLYHRAYPDALQAVKLIRSKYGVPL